MALSGQFGYIFPSTDINVASHELGHGALGLEHPFKTDADQGKTNFLLDYSVKNELWHKDWKQINDPKFRLYNFQGDSEGASQWTTIDDKFLNLDKDATDKKKGSFSFLTQHGKIISLNKNSLEEVLFNYGTSSFLGSGDQAPGILQSFITKFGNVRKLYTYRFSDGKYYADNELFIPPVIAESKIDGVIMFVPCLNQGKIYKFQKASLENFTNANAQPNNTPIDSFPFVPFSSQNPVLKNGTNVISQSFSISDGGELYVYDQATSDMSVGHCEKPELFYILKIGQIRRNYPEAFKLFTKIDNWQNPQNSSQSNGPAGGAPTVTSYQWATFLDKPENSILRSNYSNGTNLQNFFKVMYQQFSIAINTSIQSSNVFWTSLNSSTSSTEVLNQLQKESVVELGKRTIVKKILAIKILQSSPVVNETFEVELLKLIKSTTEPQTAELFTFLQNEIVSGKPFLKALISDIDNSYIFGENNRVKLVAILIGLWEKSTVFKPSREALKTILDKQELTLEDQKTIMTKTVNFNYESIYSRFWTHFKFSIFPAWAQSDTYEKTNADYDNSTKKIKIETLLALGFFNQQETKIPVSFDPFEPILFTNNSKLSAFDGVDVNQENSTNKIFPAFIVYYADEEAGIQTFCDTALTVVDVASLAIPGAQLKVLGKVLFYADKISSVSAIAARATSDNPELKKILNGISLFTGLASATTLVLKPSVLTKEKFVTNVIDKINEPTTITNNIVKEDKEIVEAFLEKTKSSLQETGQFDNATALKYNAAINKLKNATSVSKTLLLTKFTNFPKIKAWILTLDEAIDVNLLTKLDELDANYFGRLDTDLLHPVYGNEIKTLVKESPQDLENIWQKLKDEPEFSWEIKKTGGSRWEKWGQREFFKDITAKGKGFETNVCLATFKNRTSAKYLELKQKFQTDFSKNLDDYDMYSQVQLKYDGDNYFVADQLFIKRNIDGDIIDLVVIENKLSSTTPLTGLQSIAFTKTSFTVRSVKIESVTKPGQFLKSGDNILFSGSKQWYKVHDGTNGDVISGILKMN